MLQNGTLSGFVSIGHVMVSTEQIRGYVISQNDVNCVMTVSHQNEEHASKRVQPAQAVQPHPTFRCVFLFKMKRYQF